MLSIVCVAQKLSASQSVNETMHKSSTILRGLLQSVYNAIICTMSALWLYSLCIIVSASLSCGCTNVQSEAMHF